MQDSYLPEPWVKGKGFPEFVKSIRVLKGKLQLYRWRSEKVLSRLRENMLYNELELNIIGVYNVQVIRNNKDEDEVVCRI